MLFPPILVLAGVEIRILLHNVRGPKLQVPVSGRLLDATDMSRCIYQRPLTE